ncbi:MAG: hypothetical protein SF051_06975 [Elusimicrobiota bacterium]|nr:hypothetical protein [Elusimicrobiota bacterium]
MRRVFLVALLLSGCGRFGGLRPGPTEKGLAVAVAGTDPVLARRAAVESTLGLYLSPAQRAASKDALDALLSRPARFTGKEKAKDGSSVVEVRLGALAGALEEAGLVRPAGFPQGPGRVLIVLAEPAANLSAGYASDSLRRALLARGVSAADASDLLLQRPALRGKTAGEVVAEAFAAGVDFVLFGSAAAEAGAEPESGAWRAEAVLDARLKTSATAEGELIEASAAALDVSSAAAVSKALEGAGDAAAAPVAAALAAARAGRSEVLVEARGYGGPSRMGALIGTLRGLAGVKGAALHAHKTEEGGALVRVFCEGLKADELAARLIRADSSLIVLGVEPENGRLLVELGLGGG